jgi:hypothetical protein
MSAPYYVALYGGFLVVERYLADNRTITKAFTDTNVRLASQFDTFDEADATAKWAVNQLYPPDIRYFAILEVARD